MLVYPCSMMHLGQCNVVKLGQLPLAEFSRMPLGLVAAPYAMALCHLAVGLMTE